MVKDFDTDHVGSILEYGYLLGEGEHRHRQQREQWERTNLHTTAIQPIWPATGLSGPHLEVILSPGREGRFVRDRIHDGIVSLMKSGAIHTRLEPTGTPSPYMHVTILGAELCQDDCYLEYLGGFQMIFHKWRSCVVKVITDQGVGTGCYLGNNTFVTAKHIIVDGNLQSIELDRGDVLTDLNVNPHSDDRIDLAYVVSADEVDIDPFKFPRRIDAVEPVLMMGYPRVGLTRDNYLLVNRGEISATGIELFDGTTVFIVSCLLRGGYSGGPIVNNRGQLLGVVSRNLYSEVLAPVPEGEEGTVDPNADIGFAVAYSSPIIESEM